MERGFAAILEMKTKNLILSLIFPVICFLWSIITFTAAFEHADIYCKIMGYVWTAAGMFPLVSVVFLKTDIKPLVKWQAVFTAFTAVIVAAGAVIFTLFPPQTPWAGIFILIVIPLGFLTAAGIIYGKILASGEKSVLKWFTAFLSTPVLHFLLVFLWLYIALSNTKFINIPG